MHIPYEKYIPENVRVTATKTHKITKFQIDDEKKMNYTAKRAKNLPSQSCDAKTMKYTKKLAKMQKLKAKMKKR